jgi:hypothetical protein
MTWGIKGQGTRGLELPAGSIVEVSPADRARIRYNETTMQLEASLAGGAYVALAAGGGVSPWLEAGGVVRLQNITDDVVIGAAVTVGTEKLRVVGDIRVDSTVFVNALSTAPAGGATLDIGSDSGDVRVTTGTNNATGFEVTDGADAYMLVDTTTGLESVDLGGNAKLDSAILLDQGGVTATMPDNIADSFNVSDSGGDTYISVDSLNASPGINVGNTTNSPTVSLIAGPTVSTTLDAGSGISLSILDNVSDSFVLGEGANPYLTVDTVDGSELVRIGNATTNPNVEILGSGDLILGTGPLCLPELASDPAAVANTGKLYTKDDGGDTELFYRDDSGNIVQITRDGSLGSAVRVLDNDGVAWFVRDASTNTYINVATTTGFEVISFGNTINDPDVLFLGSGDIAFLGNTQLSMSERVGDPGAVANRGRIYTKDVSTVTELFYQASDGTVTQLTPASGGTPGGANTQVQYNSVGSFAGSADFTFDGTSVTLANALDVPSIDRFAGGVLSVGDTLATGIAIGQSGVLTQVDGTFTVDELATFNDGARIDSTAGTGSLAIEERVGDPGGTAQEGKIYTKDVLTITELFYQNSSGTVVQLTSGGGISSNTDIAIQDNIATAFLVHQSADAYISITTTNAAEKIDFGNASTNPEYEFLGSGGVTINGKLTVVGAIDPPSVLLSGGTALFYESNDGSTAPVSGAATGRLRYNNGTAQWEASVQGGAYSALGGAATSIPIADNTSNAFRVFETVGGDNYITANTTNGFESIVLGNAVTNPTINFLGSGTVTVTGRLNPVGGIDSGGPITVGTISGTTITLGRSGQKLIVDSESVSLPEQAGDPGATANEGQLYTKDVLTITELFYQNSSGTVVQLTSGGGLVGAADIPLADNLSAAFLVHEGVNEYIRVNTNNGSERLILGDGTRTWATFGVNTAIFGPTTGSSTFSFNVSDNNNAVGIARIGGGGTRWVQLSAIGAGAWIFGDNVLKPRMEFNITDNALSPWVVMDGAGADYHVIVTTNGSERQDFGNATTNPDTNFLGSGTVTINGAVSFATNVGFYTTTPVAQQATTGTTVGFTAGAGTAANDDSTYTGGTGASAYTVGDLVLALKNYGLLAA